VLHGIGVRVARPLVVVAVSTTVGAVLIGACGGGDPTGPAGCDESTVVSVSPGLEPTFSWPGGCRVQAVSVEQLSPYRVVWDFNTTNDLQENVFASPIQYGRLPTTGGARLGSGPFPLVAGRQYRVTLQAAGRAGCGGFTGCVPVFAVATFVP
jgi:hypothetical protein